MKRSAHRKPPGGRLAKARSDNSSAARKVALRRQVLERYPELARTPIVCETHGGDSTIFRHVYETVRQGVVFEKDGVKADKLAHTRPTWTVIFDRCEVALALGCGGHLPVTVLDVDPWGAPWEAIGAFFGSERTFAPRMVVIVNDGSGSALNMGGAWKIGYLKPYSHLFGALHVQDQYLHVARSLLGDFSAPAGYAVTHFSGYQTGNLFHYYGVLEK